MKKILALILAMLLLLSLTACGSKEEAAPAAEEAVEAPEATPEPTAEPTPEPTPTEPEWVPGMARAGYGEAFYTTLNRGDIINVIGQLKDYYIIEGNEVDLLIEKQFIRLVSEGEYESWDGFSNYGTKVYGDLDFDGEAVAELAFNQSVKVLDGGKGWLFIQYDGGEGYVREEEISKYNLSGGGYSYSGGGYSGGSSSGGSTGGDVGGGSSGGSEVVGDINLDLIAYFGPEMDELKEAAKVLADNTSAYLCLTLRGDELKVTSVGEEECEIYLESFTATLPRWLVQLEEDEKYESWTGYAFFGTVLYEEYQMRNELKKLDFNTEVTVLDKLEEAECYVVQVGEEIGYVQLDGLSAYNLQLSYGGGGSSSSGGGSTGGGGNSGGGGSTGGDSGFWTDPVI